ncbi:hypothetical protein NDU88_002056 [Pleurodeles waltl]|uniref:Uncharacterized protein n=1 Tax=Pleurodeles waltl TaxID=8319 RepID=A0AAV7R8W7_PLEWA|nr:hypothetical protein NDU88_002056 [Pleurodeles waltl]
MAKEPKAPGRPAGGATEAGEAAEAAEAGVRQSAGSRGALMAGAAGAAQAVQGQSTADLQPTCSLQFQIPRAAGDVGDAGGSPIRCPIRTLLDPLGSAMATAVRPCCSDVDCEPNDPAFQLSQSSLSALT